MPYLKARPASLPFQVIAFYKYVDLIAQSDLNFELI